MRLLLLFVPLFFLWAGEAEKEQFIKVIMQKQNPYVFDKKERLELKKAQLEAKTKENIASMEYKKAVDVEKIKQKTVAIQKEKEIEKAKVVSAPEAKKAETQSKMVWYLFILGIGLLLFLFFAFRRYQAYKERIELEKLRLQEEIHEKEMMLKQKELQAQVASKLIEAVAKGNLTQEQEEKLLQIANGSANLLENKKS
ncbi:MULTISPECIES: hypothetical protein [unclassified Nitratiruptor]|uniref:hypothetical protein n=1 Tax=unclassified Nitratiruptor TaxID=2624044 RepID=UPI00191653BF|nr:MULTISPECIES: hypothetical protein [unclassified Nitratiruptor]BCD59304.1 hypothetical protein NitYY0810_C0034 [Nitratiruptor sp. YY08-10]BCD63228.1 hypothetical protein NitYY0814_C0034 [Nitratiruptor sp. YY08-14]